jgi:hypothetical protein
MRMTKFDVLKSVNLELIVEFQSLDHEMIQSLVISWSKSLTQLDEFLESERIRKSQMTSGLEQGLRELPEILGDLPTPFCELTTKTFYRLMDLKVPGFFDKTYNKAIK